MDILTLENDFFTSLNSLLLMKSNERTSFLNQVVSTHPQQTIAQKIYGMIYELELKKEREAFQNHGHYTFDPFNSGIDNYLKDKQFAEQLRNILKIQRQKRQQEIKQKAIGDGAFVYHISNIPPEEIEDGALRPREQLEHFRDQGNVNAIFALSDSNWAMSLKLGRGISTVVRSSSQSSRRTVIVSDQDRFLAFKLQHPYSYQYKFPAELFEPNVGYNGSFNGEWYLLNNRLEINKKNCSKKSVDDVVTTDADLYFVAKGGSFHSIYSELNTKGKSVEQLLKDGKLIRYKIGDLERKKTTGLSKILPGSCHKKSDINNGRTNNGGR